MPTERGGRFDAHSSNESMAPVFYKKLAFITFYSGRAVDARRPHVATAGLSSCRGETPTMHTAEQRLAAEGIVRFRIP